MSSVFTLDDDPIVIVVPSSADIPPGNITEAEWLAIKDRVTVVEGYELADLGDVDLDGIADGQLLAWNASNQVFEPVAIQGGLQDAFDVDTQFVGPFWRLQAWGAVYVVPHGTTDGMLRIGVNTGTTSGTVATGNHTHRLPAYERAEFGPSGYMSGGTRQLATQSVVLASGVQYRIVARMKPQMRGADAGAAYYRMTLNIDGLSRTSPAGADGFWCVQGVPNKEEFTASITRTGTGSAITVTASVAFHSGAGFNVDAGELEVMAFAAR